MYITQIIQQLNEKKINTNPQLLLLHDELVPDFQPAPPMSRIRLSHGPSP